MSWREDVSEERPVFGLGDLEADDGGITVTFDDEGSLTETRHGDALKVAVTLEAAPDGYEDLNGDALEEGTEYYVMSSSARFMRQLADLSETLEGIEATIEAENTGFDREYIVG